MGADDLRHLRETLDALSRNLALVATIQRRLRRGVRHARHRLDVWAESVTPKARKVAESPADGWPTDRHEFGLAVMRARQSAGLSRPQLVAIVGVSDTTIANIEKGKRCREGNRLTLVQAFARIAQLEDPHEAL